MVVMVVGESLFYEAFDKTNFFRKAVALSRECILIFLQVVQHKPRSIKVIRYSI
jgi:hypothetical protein